VFELVADAPVEFWWLMPLSSLMRFLFCCKQVAEASAEGHQWMWESSSAVAGQVFQSCLFVTMYV